MSTPTLFQPFLRIRPNIRFGTLYLALALMVSTTHSLAATISWSGAGGDNRWSNPANWTGGVLPATGDEVVIDVPGEVTVRMDARRNPMGEVEKPPTEGRRVTLTIDIRDVRAAPRDSAVAAVRTAIMSSLGPTGTTSSR